MKNLFGNFRPFRRRTDPLAGADTPRCAEEIDLERVIWDPKYRESARKVLSRDESTRPGRKD